LHRLQRGYADQISKKLGAGTAVTSVDPVTGIPLARVGTFHNVILQSNSSLPVDDSQYVQGLGFRV
jgi:hypothetical protein